MSFKKYIRKNFSELRPVTTEEFKFGSNGLKKNKISISNEEINNGSPLPGDMIARNPKNHKDMWLVSKKYFEDNFMEFKQ